MIGLKLFNFYSLYSANKSKEDKSDLFSQNYITLPKSLKKDCFEKKNQNKIAFRASQKFTNNSINNHKNSPIRSQEEYTQIMKKLFQNPRFNDSWKNNNGNIINSGILPYAGFPDMHDEINKSIKNKDFSDDFINDIVKCLNYSLKKVDEKYGKYEGVVFRCGYLGDIDETGTIVTTQNFCSASRSMKILNNFGKNGSLNVIFTKNGHKICSVQEELANCSEKSKIFAACEKEILLDPGQKYKAITKLTPEIIKIKRKLTPLIQKLADGKHIKLKNREFPIKFWQEIE